MLIGLLGVGDRHLATQGPQGVSARIAGRDPLIDRLVDHPVDAADEETGDAGHAGDVAVGRPTGLETAHVSLGHG